MNILGTTQYGVTFGRWIDDEHGWAAVHTARILATDEQDAITVASSIPPMSRITWHTATARKV